MNVIMLRTLATALRVGSLGSGEMARASSYSYTTLDEQSGDSTYATGINSTDQIVGIYTNDTGNHGFLYNDSTYTTLDDPVGSGTEALGINDRGRSSDFTTTV